MTTVKNVTAVFTRDDLFGKEMSYLGQALFNIGAKERSSGSSLGCSTVVTLQKLPRYNQSTKLI